MDSAFDSAKDKQPAEQKVGQNVHDLRSSERVEKNNFMINPIGHFLLSILYC